MTLSPYATLPADGPYPAAIGSALITMVEPHPGHERAYNRWYEDDHFFAGATAMPWMFSGRRFVAPRDLQLLREPGDSDLARPLEAGKYIALYWITEGRYDDHLRWTVATNQRLFADGRIYADRDHVFTAFQSYAGPVYRDPTGPRDIHALLYPYPGLIVEVIDAPDGGLEELTRWHREERAPQLLADSPTAMCLAFTLLPLPEDRMSYVKQVEGLGRRLTLLWFTEDDAAAAGARFAGEAARVAASGKGRTQLLAPFTPTLPGTDTYVDQLR